MAKKVNYWDPQGNQQEGWYDAGKVYKDEGLTERIDKGSSFQNSKGQVYRMGQYGGTKVYNPTQTDKSGNWVPTGNDWYRQAQQMMFNIQDRPKFEFDLNTNALYQQYKQNYQKQGQQAMMDTMGQAAGLTGGYGSSYAQNVGQQAYNDYLTKLGDIVPELYAQERAAYDAEGDQMYRQMQAALGMYDLDYQNWRNKVGDTRYRDELSYARGRDAMADQRYADELAYGRSRDALSDQRYADELAYGRSRDAVSDQRYADQLAYDRSRDALSDQWREREWNESHRDENYSRVMQMLSAGYMPSAEELQAAGVSQSYAQYLVNRYAAAQAGTGGGVVTGGLSDSDFAALSDRITGAGGRDAALAILNGTTGLSDAQRTQLANLIDTTFAHGPGLDNSTYNGVRQTIYYALGSGNYQAAKDAFDQVEAQLDEAQYTALISMIQEWLQNHPNNTTVNPVVPKPGNQKPNPNRGGTQ